VADARTDGRGEWRVFRITYYADLFTTTFYLKNISDYRQGLRYLNDTLLPYHLYKLILLAAIATIALARTRGARTLWIEARTHLGRRRGFDSLYGEDRRRRAPSSLSLLPPLRGCALLGGLVEHRLRGLAPRSAVAVALGIAFISFFT